MSESKSPNPGELDAERIRAALIRAALDGYEQAALSGLCCEGAWEAAVSAMRRLELRATPPWVPEPGDRA
jgi:hypothetical protein